MIVFISTVLILAAFQSFCKLSLLKWRWGTAAALLLFCLPWFFESKIAASSMRDLNAALTDPANLENWCALIVIQELFTLVIGFSLLRERAEENLKRKDFWKYIVFLPSVLLPAGVLYLQMFLFNRFPALSFRSLTWLTALGIPVVLFVTLLILKLLNRKQPERILTVFHAEYFLLLPAIFLPVAAKAKLYPGGESTDFLNAALLLCVFFAVTTVFTIIFFIYNKIKRRKKSCQL